MFSPAVFLDTRAAYRSMTVTEPFVGLYWNRVTRSSFCDSWTFMSHQAETRVVISAEHRTENSISFFLIEAFRQSPNSYRYGHRDIGMTEACD